MKLRDGSGHPVPNSRRAIKVALLGATNFVGTVDDFTAHIVVDEEANDVSVYRNDSLNVESYHIRDIDHAIDAFISYAKN